MRLWPSIVSRIAAALLFAIGAAAASPQPAVAQAPPALDYDVSTAIPLVSRSAFGRGREEKIDADLFRPKRAGRLPAAVITPSSGGVATHVELYYARLLAARGMAVLVVDSFTPRGILRTVEDQSQIFVWQSIADAVAGREWLAKQDFVDPDRIIVLGMSKGAIIANRLAMTTELAAQQFRQVRFAAHVAITPACTVQVEDAKTTGAPMLFQLGEQDDYTDPKPCIDYIQRMQAAGAKNIRYAVYLGGRHAFEAIGGASEINAQIWRDECNYFRRDARTFVNRRNGAAIKGAQMDEANRACMTMKTVHVGGEQRVRDQAVADLLQFLREHGLLVDDEARAAAPNCETLTDAARARCLRVRAGFSGDAVALARDYLRGRGVPADAAQARKLFEFAVARGNAQAKWELALLLRDGKGGEGDMPRAMKLLHEAVAEDEAPALGILGVMARDGVGREKDPREAVQWFRRGAELRNTWALAHYGRALIEGLGGVSKDLSQALRLIKLSAFRGNPLGKLYHGEILAAGDLAPKDPVAAQKLFEEARAAVDADGWIKRRADEGLRKLQNAGLVK